MPITITITIRNHKYCAAVYYPSQANRVLIMADLYHVEPVPAQRVAWDRHATTGYATEAENLVALTNSTTLYVGNLSFYAKEEQILETFSMVGPVQRVVMGINRQTKTPCGFCFVEFVNQEHARAALKYLSDTVCVDRIIRCGWDSGFKDGRQYGRGRKTGGQVRDEMVDKDDPDRPAPQKQYHQQNYHRGGGGRGGRGGGHRDYNDHRHNHNNSNQNYKRGGGGFQQNERRGGRGGGGYNHNQYRDNRESNYDRERGGLDGALGKRGRDAYDEGQQDNTHYSGGGHKHYNNNRGNHEFNRDVDSFGRTYRPRESRDDHGDNR